MASECSFIKERKPWRFGPDAPRPSNSCDPRSQRTSMGVSPLFEPNQWMLVPFHFWSLVFFALGCAVGSFLNVCIYRMPLGQSIITPRSHCPHCQYSIPWFLNIPL